MAVVIHGLSDDVRLAFVASPLAELGCALQVLAQAAHGAADAVWAIDAITGADEVELAALRGYAPLFSGIRPGLFLSQAASSPTSLAEELRGLAGLEATEILASVVIALAGGVRPRSLVSSSDVVRPDYLREVTQVVSARDDGALLLLEQCRADPEAWLQDFIAFLSRCDEWFFRPLWADVMPLLSAEVQARRRVARKYGDAGALLSAIDGAHATGVTGVVRIDKLYESTINITKAGMVICVPAALGGRHLAVKDELSPPVLHYPLPAPHNRPSPSARLVSDRLHALGNLNRLELCRDLLRQPRTTRELADRWAMDAGQVSRHLRVLREVGLVSIERRGRLVFYRLNGHEVTLLGQDVMDSLLR